MLHITNGKNECVLLVAAIISHFHLFGNRPLEQTCETSLRRTIPLIPVQLGFIEHVVSQIL